VSFRSTRSFRRTGAFVFAVLAGFVFLSNYTMAEPNSPAPRRDINDVLRAHDKELLAISGVVGVYVAVLDDGKTPCLKIMLAQKSAETERRIPRTIEGYPVVLEVTGEIRPAH
jgi:hypothetical protein